jgi:hypothetical protein
LFAFAPVSPGGGIYPEVHTSSECTPFARILPSVVSGALGDHTITGGRDGFSLGPGRKANPAAIIPNMAIRNSDVIVQAMVRLLLHNAWTAPPKAQRANAVVVIALSKVARNARARRNIQCHTQDRPIPGRPDEAPVLAAPANDWAMAL